MDYPKILETLITKDTERRQTQHYYYYYYYNIEHNTLCTDSSLQHCSFSSIMCQSGDFNVIGICADSSIPMNGSLSEV